HEEVSRLPERYRAPLVLCYLEGATQEAAAVQLSLAKGTLRERLERGRTLLRTRLLHRGLGPSAFLVTAAWSAAKASASVPMAVVVSTVKAATAVATGATAAGVVPPNVTALSALLNGGAPTMFLTKFRLTLGVVLAVCALGLAAGIVAYSQPPGQPED